MRALPERALRERRRAVLHRVAREAPRHGGQGARRRRPRLLASHHQLPGDADARVCSLTRPVGPAHVPCPPSCSTRDARVRLGTIETHALSVRVTDVKSTSAEEALRVGDKHPRLRQAPARRQSVGRGAAWRGARAADAVGAAQSGNRSEGLRAARGVTLEVSAVWPCVTDIESHVRSCSGRSGYFTISMKLIFY